MNRAHVLGGGADLLQQRLLRHWCSSRTTTLPSSARLRTLVRSEDFQCETYRTVEELIARRRAAVPSCLVLDVSRSGLSGLDLQKRLAIELPEMPIIFIAADVDVPMTVKVIKAGSQSFSQSHSRMTCR